MRGLLAKVADYPVDSFEVVSVRWVEAVGAVQIPTGRQVVLELGVSAVALLQRVHILGIELQGAIQRLESICFPNAGSAT